MSSVGVPTSDYCGSMNVNVLTLSDLIQGVQYVFRGASMNSFGMSSSYSNIQTVTPCTAGSVCVNWVLVLLTTLSTQHSKRRPV